MDRARKGEPSGGEGVGEVSCGTTSMHAPGAPCAAVRRFCPGLLVCGKCGHSMAPQYNSGYARYSCTREAVDYGGKLCTSIRASSVDEAVSALVLRALEPAALDVSLEVAENIEAERRRLDDSWHLRLERAQYDVDRAMRQYNAVEPENRLVARTIERQLEDKLNAQRSLQEEHRRFEAQQPTTLSAEERATIRALAGEHPSTLVRGLDVRWGTSDDRATAR